MKRLLLTALVSLALPATASAHSIDTHHGCNWWGVNCDGSLTDTEALWATISVIQVQHPSTKTEPSWHGVTSRPSSSSRWTIHGWGGDRKTQWHKCLVDVDREVGAAGGYTTYVKCYFIDAATAKAKLRAVGVRSARMMKR